MKRYLFILCGLMATGCITTRSQMKQQEEKISQIQETKADKLARLDEVDEQLRSLNGRIEVLEKQQLDLAQLSTKKSDDEKLDEEINKNKFKLIEEALLKIEKEMNLLRQDIENLKDRSTSKSETKSSNKGNYSQAESDFGQKNWKKAIVGYQKYRELNPKGKLYSEATYKIGVCFAELGMKDEAKAFFDEVVEKFPKSRIAQKADYRLKNLK